MKTKVTKRFPRRWSATYRTCGNLIILDVASNGVEIKVFQPYWDGGIAE
jgi:hypothetical protein